MLEVVLVTGLMEHLANGAFDLVCVGNLFIGNNAVTWSAATLQPRAWVREWLSSRVPATGPPVHNSALPAIPRATARISIAVHSAGGVPVP